MATRKRTPKPRGGFFVDHALAVADEILASPPKRDHIVRPTPRGALVARFALPLPLCNPQNKMLTRSMQAAAWRIGKLKENVLLCMLSQHGRRSEPLPGRPQVLCVRFSSVEPDTYSDWAKHAVDKLCVAHRGLGFLRDDKPSAVELHQRWEPAPAGKGFVMIEVRSDV